MWSTEKSSRVSEGSARAPLPAPTNGGLSDDSYRARLKEQLWNLTLGPLLALSVIGLIAFLEAAFGWNTPNPPAILSMIIVFAAFTGGLWGGIITASISCVYFAIYFSDEGMPFHYTRENLLRVIIFIVTTVTVAIITSIVKRRVYGGAQERMPMEREGLLLCFSTRLSAFDKLLVEGMVVGVLGRETDCYVAEYRVQGDTAIVRLCGSSRADLERVAEALYLRVWEQVHVHQVALVRMADVLQPSTLKAGLGDLFGQRLAHMELREALPAVIRSGSSDGALINTWTSKAPGSAPLRWTWHRPGLPGEDRIVTEARPRRIFVCHAPDDLKHAKSLCTHLSVLHRQGLIETFRVEDILPGTTVSDVLGERLEDRSV